MNTHNYFLRLSITILFIYNALFSSALSFMPLIRYYSVKEYKAANQNWSVTQGQNGVMYFGNTDGLLSYDGYHWNLIKVAGGQIVRSVFADGKRIYVGSFEEFGYFEATATGQMQYHSISKMLHNFKFENDEIWKIVKVKNTICFQSFGACFIYDGKTVTGYRNYVHTPLFIYSCHNKMYVQLINEGFALFDGHSYHEIIHRSDLDNSDVLAVLPFKKNQLLLITKKGKIYIYSNNKQLVQFTTQIDDVLKKAYVNRAIMTKDNKLIIGTISNGIYVIRKDGSLLWHFNRNERLNNNTVLGLICDVNNNLWVALDDGIAYIQYNSPLTVLSPSSDKHPIGMVYSMLHRKDYFYLGTNQGVYKINTETNESKMIPNSAEQNWYLEEFDNQIFSGSNNSVMNIVNDVGIPVPGTLGSTYIKHCIINGKEILLNASYVGLSVFVKNSSGQWVFSHKIKGFSNPIKNFVVDQDGSIWLSHMYKGAYHLWLKDDLRSVRYKEFISNLDNDKESGNINVMKIQGNIILADNKKMYVYSTIRHQLIPFQQLNKILPPHCTISGATEVNSHLFWIITSTEYILVDVDKDKYHIKSIVSFSNFDNTNHSESFVYIDKKGDSYFNLYNGIARFDISYQNKFSQPQKIKIGKVQGFNQRRESVLLPIDEKGTMKSDFREISFELLMPHYNRELYSIHYQLKGNGLDLVSDSYNPTINYSSLDFGTYRFKAVIYNDLNQKIGEEHYQFTINRPFFFSWGAILFYIILLGLTIYYLTKWRLHYLMKKEKKEHEALQARQNSKMHEQELLISEQNKKILEAEVAAKSKELASMTMGIILKNSVLEEFRTEIQAQMKKGPITVKFMQQLLLKIDKKTDNEEFWGVFQQNFDLIHANFFRHLRERYPELTSKDLRFCALLRLNMFTKDIAQLDNLSVRGVEAARYRIRKKLNIPEGTSLVDFLIELK
ncbi:MAG: hypothetical protein WCR45_02915 [Bacteroidaceae bacterium]